MTDGGDRVAASGWRVVVGIVLPAIVATAGACTDDRARRSPPTVSQVEGSPAATARTRLVIRMGGSGCAYRGPAEVAAGRGTFRFSADPAPADFDVWRLDEGHVYGELVAHMEEDVRRLTEGLPPLGHPDFAALVGEVTTDDAGRATLDVPLEPGEYGIACIRFGGGGLDALLPAGPIEVR
jgi:hypothetical protein